ncbi:MAG: Na+/H+ antiporter subunit E [Lachnospiraceae bacterium]|nr:Na+/H+ antiporter subunit E [Lachnospiraceae bacterium]MDD7177766.1 Na+/H+ antiporter subunit E [bacterium]MDY5516577.1 Na+/H+ antiporter subunit E [Lachnospiraceae bacterium]
MYLVFLLIWIIFNEKFNLEILLFGLVISAAVFTFVCKFMDYSIKKELHFYRKLPGMLCYVFVLVKEILMANLNVCHLILSEEEEIEPALVQFTADMETPAGRAFYANAITLTPGTITVSLEGDTYVVHCLDESMAEGLADAKLEQMLHEIEQG